MPQPGNTRALLILKHRPILQPGLDLLFSAFAGSDRHLSPAIKEQRVTLLDFNNGAQQT